MSQELTLKKCDPRSCTVCVGNVPYAFYKSHLGGRCPFIAIPWHFFTSQVLLIQFGWLCLASLDLHSFSWVKHDSCPALWGINQLQWFGLEVAPATMDGQQWIRVTVSDVTFRMNWIFPGIQKSLGYTRLVLYFAFLGSLSLYLCKIDILLISYDGNGPDYGGQCSLCTYLSQKTTWQPVKAGYELGLPGSSSTKGPVAWGSDGVVWNIWETVKSQCDLIHLNPDVKNLWPL